MRTPEEQAILDALHGAYDLGVDACKYINFGRGMSKTAKRRERAALNKLLKTLGLARLTDTEYSPYKS